MSAIRGHCQLEHTADLAFKIWAPNESELLEEGAQALKLVLCGTEPMGRSHHREVRLAAASAEERLVCWLNEVLYLAVTHGFVTTQCTVRLQAEGAREAQTETETSFGLHASLWGSDDSFATIATELKSVTYHDLSIQVRADGSCEATVVVDV